MLWLLTGYYTVPASEVAIVERLGQYVSGEKGQVVLEEPGQHYGLPWPLDVIHRVPFNSTRIITVAKFYVPPPAYEEIKQEWLRIPGGPSREVLDAILDPYLITADKNILKANATVQYKVVDPHACLMAMAHAASTADADAVVAPLKEVIAHALIEEMAKTPVDVALGEGRADLASRVQRAMAPDIARLNLGVEVTNVTLEITWPANVDADFRRVTEARVGMDTARKNAEVQANSAVTQAEFGDKPAILSRAQAYKAQVIADAQGEADRFRQVFARYEAAPELTRASLYADAVVDILGNVTRKVYVQKGERPTLVVDRPEDMPRPAAAAPR